MFKIKTLLSLLVLSSITQAIEYYDLSEDKVYDVELIIFAYQTSLPDSESYSNKKLFQTIDSLHLEPLDTELLPELFRSNLSENPNQMSIPLEEDSELFEALAGFEKLREESTVEAIWNELDKSSSTLPLVYKSWRITASEFTNPEFLLVNDINAIPGESIVENQDDSTVDGFKEYNSEQLENEFIDELNPEYQIHGSVSLSQGRYLHFGHQLNLIRYLETFDSDSKFEFVFTLDERKQIKPGELNYFDSPWFGSLVKVTEVEYQELEQENENEE